MKRIKPYMFTSCCMLRSLVSIFLILFYANLSAAEFSEAEVRAAVQNWVRYMTADSQPDAVVEKMEPHRVSGQVVAYIAHLQNGGFCLVGADDRVLPVYLYSRLQPLSLK